MFNGGACRNAGEALVAAKAEGHEWVLQVGLPGEPNPWPWHVIWDPRGPAHVVCSSWEMARVGRVPGRWALYQVVQPNAFTSILERRAVMAYDGPAQV
jgi:hypothetical protein